MMKRNYIVPKVRCITIDTGDLIAHTNVVPEGNEGVEGLPITEGEPVDGWDAKQQSVWDNEW